MGKSLLYHISKDLCECLFLIALKPINDVFCALPLVQIYLFIKIIVDPSSICLPILPILFFAGLISLVVRWLKKISLWSFKVIKPLSFPLTSIIWFNSPNSTSVKLILVNISCVYCKNTFHQTIKNCEIRENQLLLLVEVKSKNQRPQQENT